MAKRIDTLDILPLSTRAKNVLRSADCKSLEEISQQYEGFLKGCSGLGKKTAQEIEVFLVEQNIKLRRHPSQSASFMLGELLARMVRLEKELDEARREIWKLLEEHPDLDWTKIE